MRALVFSTVIALVALTLSVGCDRSSGQRETCSPCRGSGRASSGPACLSCSGRGYREVSRSEVDRRARAETNLRRRGSGEEPVSDADWWWETGGKGLVGFVVGGLALYFLTGQHRKGRSGPPGRAPNSTPPNT